ncbi:MAG: hypothetical protein P8P36_00405 [Akkermansiaceae bacterium]|nr:hypothetical protein [Akkermansiaceae bacterium]
MAEAERIAIENQARNAILYLGDIRLGAWYAAWLLNGSRATESLCAIWTAVGLAGEYFKCDIETVT